MVGWATRCLPYTCFANGKLQSSYYVIREGKQVSISNPNVKPIRVPPSNLHRPPLRISTKNTVYGDYVKLPNGNYALKTNTSIVVQGPVHIAHRYGWENRRLLKAADELGMTQKQLNDYVNDPRRTKQLFELQNGPENMGHRFEKPGNGDLDKIKDDMQKFLNERK